VTITHGNSVMTARPIASCFERHAGAARAGDGDRAGERRRPMTEHIAAISSSAWKTRTSNPALGELCRTPLAGVIG